MNRLLLLLFGCKKGAAPILSLFKFCRFFLMPISENFLIFAPTISRLGTNPAIS